MAVLVDTCILLRAFERRSPEFVMIRQALRRSIESQEKLIVCIQNIAEFWNVATRPLANNGQGLTAERAKRRLTLIERLCDVLSEDAQSYLRWKEIVDRLGVSGVAVHDARLVSVLLGSGSKQVMTLNVRDFRRYEAEGLQIVTPESYLAGSDERSP